MKQESKPIHFWGYIFQAEEAARAKALRKGLFGMLEEQQRGQCNWHKEKCHME